MSPLLLAAVPGLRPDPDPARDWVRAELAKREYQPTLLERLRDWLQDLLSRLLDAAGGFGRLDPVIAIVLLIGLLVLVAVVLARLRPGSSGPAKPGAVLTDRPMSAAEHRGLAERALAAGRWEEAVVESVRAIAVGLVERALLDDQPGATAREVADRGAALFPALADRLHAAADVFDGVRYGERRAQRAEATELLDLEGALRRTRPAAEPEAVPVLAVPR